MKNKKWGFDYKNKNKNKNQKIIFEYAQNCENLEKNNFTKLNINKINDINNNINYNKNYGIRIRKFLYDEKAEMAFENKEKDEDNELDKIDKYFNDFEMNMNIVINRDEVNELIKRIHNKYKNSKKLDKNKMEEVVCSCIGDFQKISNLIENMI